MKSRLCLATYALIGALAGPGAIALTFALAPPLAAQTVTNAFGGLSESSDEPINIESDVLVVHDKQKYATFEGKVKAVQGTTTLRAKQLDVHYVGGDKLGSGANKGSEDQAAPATKVADAQATGGATAGTGGDTKISKIEAKGDVFITSKDDQTTTSDWAIYDVPAQLVTVGGNVVLTQGKNVLKGDRLVIDLKTGESRFENTGDTAAGGRIRALFMPKQEGAGNAKSGEAKPGDAQSGEPKSEGTTAEDKTSGGQMPDAAGTANGSQDAGEPPNNDTMPLDPMRH